MQKALLLAMLLAVTTDGFAQTRFYQCKDQWGNPVFSQRPCGADATEGSVTSQASISGTSAPAETPPAAAATGSAPVLEESVSSWDKVTASRRLREIEREVDRREDTIDRLERERDARIAELNRRQGYANNNLAGAQYMESLATEMQAVNSQYDAKVSSEQRKIDRLLDEAERHREIL